QIFGTAKIRGAFSARVADGALLANVPGPGLANEPGALVIGASKLFFSEAPGTQPSFYTAPFDLGSYSSDPVSSEASNAPAIAAGGSILVLSSEGRISLRSADGSLVWSALVDQGQSFVGSPTIDCARDGGTRVSSPTGPLYVGGVSGNLYAIVVDGA